MVRGEMLEGLRLLLCTDAELRAENAIVESIIQTPMFMTNDDFEDSVFKKVGAQTHASYTIMWVTLTIIRLLGPQCCAPFFSTARERIPMSHWPGYLCGCGAGAKGVGHGAGRDGGPDPGVHGGEGAPSLVAGRMGHARTGGR